jgi:TolB-like protein
MKPAVFAAIVLLPANVFGLSIYVAPLLYVDETNQSRRNSVTVQSDLLAALWSAETGTVLQFGRLRDNRINPPQSLTDAVTVSRNEQIDYLLYGHVTRRAHNIQMEIRLFDYANRQVMQSFFSIDDSNNYERMINDMALKILAYIGEVFELEIVPEKPSFIRLSIPVSLGYWTPVERNWVDVMLGTVTGGSGLELIPGDNLFTYRGKTCYLSTGIDIKYRFGIGNPNRYEAYNHTLYITIPLRLNIVLERQHEMFAGLGLVYFLDFFSMADKYDSMQSYIFSNMGLNLNFGYRFAFNEVFSMFFRCDFDFLFSERILATFSPAIGVNIQVYNKEAAR